MPDSTIDVVNTNTNASTILNRAREELYNRIRDQVSVSTPNPRYVSWRVNEIGEQFVEELNEKIYGDAMQYLGYAAYTTGWKEKLVNSRQKNMRKQPDRQVGIYKGHKIICSERVGDGMCFLINDSFYINGYHTISHKVLEELLQFN